MKNKPSSLYIVVSVSVVATLLFVILGAFAGGLIVAPYLLDEVQAAPGAQGSQIDKEEFVAAFEEALIDLYQGAVPSVVNISVSKRFDASEFEDFDFDLHPFIPRPDEDPDSPDEFFFDQGQGSGFVWDKDGHIITNNHVVSDAEEIIVRFANGKTVEAELLGTDPDADLAVIRVDMSASELQPLAIGDSAELRVGQLAIAIGNPFGQDFTMTTGIVSALDRTIRSGRTPFSIPEVIQTDAPINPGNSGGPLLNRHGEVIGINTQIISRSGGSSGIGFAVPVNIAKRVIPTLIEGKEVDYAWLGITGRTMDPETAEAMELPLDTTGALVIALSEGGPAEDAGLQGSDGTFENSGFEVEIGGDVITAIDGKAVEDMDDLIAYLITDYQPDDQVELAVIHGDGTEETITVTLGERPSASELLGLRDDAETDSEEE
jgi:2-alkenal reductase